MLRLCFMVYVLYYIWEALEEIHSAHECYALEPSFRTAINGLESSQSIQRIATSGLEIEMSRPGSIENLACARYYAIEVVQLFAGEKLKFEEKCRLRCHSRDLTKKKNQN
ncbi:hypothetical protein AVEN_50086-1 [Araneus ventricosus]|uniref:Uncharacterized protein n=1 Tax=Araneus ventricosus TaxID=182803 RepID=A0A4Y2WAG1_ARAVE|nr:hypothetical protein AVEN_50086-1 [Araneus ventricosus]